MYILTNVRTRATILANCHTCVRSPPPERVFLCPTYKPWPAFPAGFFIPTPAACGVSLMLNQHEKRAMPEKTIDLWNAAIAVFHLYWPNLFMASLAFIITLLRGIYTGSKWKRSLLEGGIVFFFSIATLPAAVKAGVPIEYAGALMAAIAVIGLDLSRERLVNWVDRLFIKWVGK